MTPPAGPPMGGKNKKPGGGLTKNQKIGAGVGAVGGVALLALYMRSKGGSSGGSSTTATTASPGTPGVYDSTGQDLYNSVESQIEALQRAIGQSQTQTPPPISVPPNKPPPIGLPPVPKRHPKPKPRFPGGPRKGGSVPRSPGLPGSPRPTPRRPAPRRITTPMIRARKK